MGQDAAIFLGTFAAIAFVLKVTILFNIRIRDSVSATFAELCLFFIIQNAAEFLGYFTYLRSESLGQFFIHVYMLMLFFVIPGILLLALAMTRFPWLRHARYVLYSVTTLFCLAYFGGKIVSGFTYLGWSVVTNPGPLYWFAMTYVLLCLVGTHGYLLLQLVYTKQAEIRQNSRVNLLALMPITLVAVGVLGLRLAGINSSSAVSMPLATLLFLYILLLHTNGNLFWVSTKLKSIFVVIKCDHRASFETIIRELEKLRIEEALKVTRGEQKSAAKLLGLTAPTLNKRLSKYDIDVQAFK